jgi:hypothetical protein
LQNQAVSYAEETPPKIPRKVLDLQKEHSTLDAEITKLQSRRDPHLDDTIKAKKRRRCVVKTMIRELGYEPAPSAAERRKGFHIVH